MKKFIHISLYLFLLVTFGCENVDIITPDLNYNEKIVVRAELKAYSVFSGVTFTKTLPLDEVYDIKNAELKNVTAYLRINESRILTLKYTNDGIYLPLDDLKIHPGETYELFADIDGSSIYSKTKIPLDPTIISAKLKDDRVINVTIKPRSGEVYGAAWEVYNSSTGNLLDEATDFKNIVKPNGSEASAQMDIITKDIPDQYTSGGYSDLMYANVFAFDEQYLKFFNTKNNNQQTENVFAQGGDQISWNVEGENVIGLFIGMTNVSHVKVN